MSKYIDAFLLLVRESCGEHCTRQYENGCKSCSDAYDLIESVVDKYDKYRWHDLRKDPSDLPVYSEMVCVALKYADGDILTTAKVYNHDSEMFDGYHVVGYYETGLITEVIAWREIEPFSEVE